MGLGGGRLGLDPDGDGTYFEGTDAETEGTTWADLVGVPDVLQNLGDSAKALLKDPRTYIIGVILEWFVGGILDFVAQVIDLVLSAWLLVASIPGQVGGTFGAAGAVISSGAFGAIGTLTEMSVGFLMGLGWAAPLVFALLVLVFLEAAEEVGPPAAAALSDLLGAIPVVGSILDAVLTFAIGLASRLGGGDS